MLVNKSSVSVPAWVIAIWGLIVSIPVTFAVVIVQRMLFGIWSEIIAGGERADFSTNGANWLNIAMIVFAPLDFLAIAFTFVLVYPIAYSNSLQDNSSLGKSRLPWAMVGLLALASPLVFGLDLFAVTIVIPTLAIIFFASKAFLSWADTQRKV